MQSLYTIYRAIKEKVKGANTLSTGFTKIDAFLDGGFARKEIVIIGGDTGSGKSYLAGQIAFNMAKNKKKCGYFSLEISNEMIVSRILGQIANAKANLVLNNELEPFEESRVQDSFDNFVFDARDLVFYDDIYEMEEIEKAVKKMQFDFIIIDFIQNVVHKGDEYERLSHVAKKFQRLAKSQNCGILLLSQLSNTIADSKEEFQKPRFKGSGQIGIVSDQSFLIQRNTALDTVMDLALIKNRRGEGKRLFQFALSFPGMKFTEI